MTKLKTHCGCCLQCLDRRFATLAAGLGEAEPEEMYAVDLLTGPRDEGPDRTMAANFVRHAREFVSLARWDSSAVSAGMSLGQPGAFLALPPTR